jgi:MftR C-terminal domain
VIAEFVAERTAAYEHWFDNPAADLGALLDSAMRELNAAFTGSLSEQEPEVHAP